MCRLVILLLAFAPVALRAQQATLSGTVTEDQDPVAGAVVQLAGTTLSDTTDAAGRFAIMDVEAGTYDLWVDLPGHARLVHAVSVKDDVTLEELSFYTAGMSYEDGGLPVVTIAEADFEDDDGEDVAGILGASRDAFESAAAYRFGAARFRLRGYNQKHFSAYMNGAPMTDLRRGRNMYYLWSGLNDMVRNRESVTGLTPANYAFGGAGGSYLIDSRAAGQRKQAQFTWSSANGSYTNRIMGSYGTGILPGGWSFALGGSRRWAQEGYVDGTFYDSWGYFGSAEKIFHPNHSLALTIIGAPSRAGLASASVREMNELAGTNYYNPNWGYQDGQKRNARVREGHQPATILTHDYAINESVSVFSAVGYVTGRSAVSSLDWFEAPDPRPDYYRNLPSWYYVQGFTGAGDQLAQLLRNDEAARQVDWDMMYQANFLSGDTAVYVLSDRVTENDILSFNSVITLSGDGNTINGGLSFVSQQSEHYKEVNDLLGAAYVLDINKFARRDFPGTPEAYQNDLENPDRRATEGEKFSYHYTASVRRSAAWLQARIEKSKFDYFAAAELSSVSFFRDGHYRNGLFPDSSLGKSETLDFYNYSLKAGITYKVDGRNYFYLNAFSGTKAPVFENSFVSPRTRNQVAPGLENEDIRMVEGGYQLKAPRLKVRLTGFLGVFSNGTRTKSYYDDSNDAFVNYTQKGVETTHRGIEAGVNADIGGGWSIEAAAAVGEYYYSERPVAVVTQDNLATVITANDTVFIKNLHVAGTPQTALTMGIKYRSPRHWFITANVNYFDRTYIDYFPGRRNREALDLVEPGSDDWQAILRQEETGGQVTVDMFARWSWKLDNTFRSMKKRNYLVFQLGVNNLLNNKELITGGYEYSRYSEIDDLEFFTPKYYFAYGTTYYLSLILRFN